MIPFVEIKDKYTLKTLNIVEPQECWFELSYQDVGEFEVYCRATQKNLSLMQKGRYVTIPNKRFIWVITSIQYTFTAGGTRMISAKGFEAKWLLSKRCIQKPKELFGTITSAVYGLVNNEMGLGASAERKVVGFTVDALELPNPISVDGTQAPRGNLLEFVNGLLKMYGCGSQVIHENGLLVYKILNGRVKTSSIRFGQSLDNLLSSDYSTDDTELATNALVVSTVEDVDYTQTYDTGAVGIDRAEIVVSSNISTKYEDANGTERETTPTSDLYKGWQIQEGKNELSEHITVEEITGELDVENSGYTFDVDFFLGDLVRTQDEYFGYFKDTRISKYTLKQDANGYSEAAAYEA